MSKTHTSVTVWLADDPEVKVHVTEGTSWATVGSDVVIHALSDTGAADLGLLETFFRRGLDAILAAQNPTLFEKVPTERGA